MTTPDQKLIMVIDDDKDILEAIKIMLETEGFAVDTAFNSKVGLEKVAKTCPDLILVDMMMETVDAGAKMTEEIKNSGCNAPILMLSSISNATSYNLDISAMGFSGSIQKPIMPAVLIPLIKQKLGMKSNA
jgi:CheY-like chemotaxis protein